MSRTKMNAHLAMTLEELRRATRQYDDPNYAPKALPATAAEQARLARAIRSLRRGYRPGVRGRSKVGKGARRIMITMEAGLLRKADALAKQRRISRSELLALGLEAMLNPAA